jgi:ferredoxin, 2Fe-2S
MPRVYFQDVRGETKTISTRGGLTLMEVAVQNNVSGIDAECGGACACATCHVYVDDAWRDVVGRPGLQESELLDGLERRRPNSRLSCQIKFVDELDGLIVTMPEKQGNGETQA